MLKKLLLRLKKGRKTRLILVIAIIIVVTPLVVNTLLTRPKKAAAWFNDEWRYRKKAVINNSLTAQSNYAYGFSMGSITSGQINNDCSDIRVTDSNSTPISDPFWVDCTVPTSPTIWIKFSTFATGSTTLYIYYGNPSASSTQSNPDSIFLWNYDFAGSTVNTSKLTQGGGANIQSDYFSLRNNLMNSWDVYAYAASTQTRAANLTFQAKFKSDSNAHTYIGWHDNTAGTSYDSLIHGIYLNNGTFDAIEDGVDRTGSGTFTTDTWYDVKIVLKATGATFYYKAVSDNTWTSIYDSNYSSETPLMPGVHHYDDRYYTYTDSWTVRQQLSTEPTVTLDSEEKTEEPAASWKFDEGYNQAINLPMRKIEQQINILDQLYSTQSISYTPTDNSLGVIHWDADKYPGATVYFEAIMKTDSDSQNVAYISLFDTSGNAVAGSEVQTSMVNPFRHRSGPLTLTDGTDYTIRLKGYSASYIAYVQAARLIIVQSVKDKITSTQTQIEIGNNETTTQTAYTNLTDKKVWTYTSRLYNPVPSIYFEATISNNTAGQTAYAALYTDGATCSSVVSGSEVTVTGTTWTRVRSSAITLSSGTSYSVCIKAGANTARIANAKVIIDQSDSINGISDLEIHHIYNAKTGTSVTSSSSFVINYQNIYDPTHFTGIPKAYIDSTYKVSCSNAWIYLRNVTDSTNPTPYVTTNSTSYVHQRSTDLSSDLPTSEKVIDVNPRTDNGGCTNTTSATSLALYFSNYLLSGTRDTSSNKNHLSMENSPTWKTGTDCISGNCLYLDGSDDKLIASDSATLDFAATDDFTLSAWFKHKESTSGVDTILAKYLSSTGTDGGYKLYMESDGDITFAIDDDSTWGPDDTITSTAANYDDNKWHHVAAVKDGTTGIYLYIDGILVHSKTPPTANQTLANTDSLYIGVDGNGSSNPWEGFLDEVKIYPVAKSANDIKNLYNGGSTVFTGRKYSLNDGLVSYWKMDETTNGSSKTDFSGNGYTLSDNNTVATASGKFGSGSEYVPASNQFFSVSKQLSESTVETSTSSAATANSFQRKTWYDGTRYWQALNTNTRIEFWYSVDGSSWTENTGARIAIDTNEFSIEADSSNAFIIYINSPTLSARKATSYPGVSFTWSSESNVTAGGNPLNSTISRDSTGRIWVESYISTCFVAGTKITMLGGLTKNIEDIKEGETVVGLDSNSDIPARNKVVGTMKHQTSEYIILETAKSLVYVTDSHPFYIGHGEYKMVKDLNIGDTVYNYDVQSDTVTPDMITGKKTVYKSVDVYNLATDNFHNYIAQNLVVHNKGIEALSVSTYTSTNANDITSWGSFKRITDITSDITKHGIVVPLASDHMYTVINDRGTIKGCLYDADNSPSARWEDSSGNDCTGGSNYDSIATGIASLSQSIALVHDTTNNYLHLSYIDSSGNVKYQKYTTSWQTAVTLDNNSGNSNPTISIDSQSGDLMTFWIRSNSIYFKKGSSPYTTTDWDESASNYVGSGSNSQLTAEYSNNGAGKMFVGWTQGSASPYNIKWGIVSTLPSPSVKTVSFWTNPDALTNYYVNLTSSANIQSNSSGVISANGFANPKTYINGVAGNTLSANTWSLVTVTSDTAISADQFYIGRIGSNYYDGTLDEVKLYNRVITPGEVENLYNWSPGPAGWWKMDENQGSLANDSSGNSNNGTITGGNGGWNLGKFGSSYEFDASSTSINTGSGSSLDNIPASGMTLEAWVYPHTQGENNAGVIMSKNNGSTPASGWLLQLAGTNAITFTVDGSTDLVRTTSNGSLITNAWNHVALVWDGVMTTAATADIYINGVEATYTTTTNGASRVDDGSSTFYIGNDSSGASTFDGLIDDAKVYNYVRLQQQIIEDMNAGHPAPGSPIGSALGEWKFDEGLGDTAYNAGNGGSALNGDLFGTCPGDTTCPAWSSSGKFEKALLFDGSNDYVSVPDNAVWDASDDLTISLWVKRNGYNQNDSLVSRWNETGAKRVWSLVFSNSSGQLRFDTSSTGSYLGQAVYSTTNISTGSWYHVVVVHNSSDATNKIYINGKLDVVKPAVATALFDTDVPVYFGYSPNFSSAARYLNGGLDDIKLYNSALTEDQIKTLYNGGFSNVMGAVSTASSSAGIFSSARSYCPPGDTGTCNPPISELKFEESTWNNDCSTNTVFDTSGYRNDGDSCPAGSGMTESIPGKIGNAGNFDGVDDYLEISESWANTLTNFSVSAWVYLNSLDGSGTSQYKVYDRLNGDGSFPRLGILGDGRVSFQFAKATIVTNVQTASPDILTARAWYHLVTTYDHATNTGTLYINGVKVKTGTSASGALDGGSNDTRIGHISTGSNYFSGKIDDFKVYNYTRTPAQIAWDYNQGAPQVWYKFDECTGITANNLAPAASGGDSENDATIYPVTAGNDATGSCSSGDTTEMWNNGTTGKINSSLDFDGSDDYAATANSAIIAGTGGTYTNISWGGWFKPAGTPTSDSLIMKGNGNTTNEFRLSTDGSGYPQCEIYYSAGWHTIAKYTSSLSTSWQHIVCTYDGSYGRLYINGKLTDYKSDSNSITSSSSSPLTIASDPNNGTRQSFFDGQADEVKIWGYSLTPEQVRTDYNGGSAVKFY